MKSNIEIESKVLLTKTEYESVIKSLHLENTPKVKQTNYYIDTKDLYLKKHDMFLRIREKSQNYELTLKAPLSEGLLEKNEHIASSSFDKLQEDGFFPEGGIKKFLEILSVDPKDLKILTSLTTTRIEIEYKNSIVDIDRSVYGDVVDYELEVETTSMEGAEAIAKEILKLAKVEGKTFNKLSKQSRALNAIKK